jgi:hypothetical protein
VLEIINSLLSHLRVSVTHEVPSCEPQAQHDEKLYQEALINALGEFANHLPDYQKIEIMMFIMSKVPYPSLDHFRGFSGPGDVMLQNILLKSLLKVLVVLSNCLWMLWSAPIKIFPIYCCPSFNIQMH